jgi:rare lipoprotein A
MLLAGCSAVTAQPAWKLAVAGDGPGNPEHLGSAEVVVQNLPKSRSGNSSKYSVFGQAYKVMESAHGFTQSGVASWYGKKFHGRPTASGELYDMHKMTAAHKSLPLPTFVRVTRMDTGKSLVVKVNDRGPFVADRIIDLSYAAAVELDLLEVGKAEVFIEALSTHEPAVEANVQPDNILVAPTPSTVAAKPAVALSDAPDARESGKTPEMKFLQVGAYSDAANAEAMLESLRGFLSEVPAEISHDADLNLFRVRIGPLSDQLMMREAQGSLSLAGIESYRVTTAIP